MGRQLRTRNSRALLSVMCAFTIGIMGGTVVQAKKPGRYSCYKQLCWKVATLDKLDEIKGQPFIVKASFYDSHEVDPHTPRNITSSGEIFRHDRLDRIASPNLPNGTKVLLWDKETGLAIHAMVNDTGPFRGNRVVDLPIGLARTIGREKLGIISLQMVVVERPTTTQLRHIANRDYAFKGGILGTFKTLRDAILALDTPALSKQFDKYSGNQAVAMLSFGRKVRPRVKTVAFNQTLSKNKKAADLKTVAVKRLAGSWKNEAFGLE